MSDQELTGTEFVVLMVDIHDVAKRSPCTETDSDKIKEQAINIARGTQYSKLFETLYNPVIHVNTVTVDGNNTITMSREDFSHRKP